MRRMIRGVAAASGLVFAVFAATAGAQERVRGTIERVDGQAYVVKARDGAELKVRLPDNAVIVAMVKASFADIKPGSFVGVTGMPQPDGSQKAVEIHIFPEAMRGTGEGHRPWDLHPQSTMTNGTVEQVAAVVDGHTLTIKYKEGEKKVIVSPETPVILYAKGNWSDLTPGTKIFISAATRRPDGTLEAPRINFGKDGLTPSM